MLFARALLSALGKNRLGFRNKGFLSELVCNMTEVSPAVPSDKVLKRANEENEDTAAAKKLKTENSQKMSRNIRKESGFTHRLLWERILWHAEKPRKLAVQNY
ncbi:hypothetical protein WMY93_021260 [Mugilogobius chulae]|uniref:Uncharacterized protein n=1 Tax=Mugilogobius chulae TaxID=88201 RepID=A0AAW0NBN0_9GOBI